MLYEDRKTYWAEFSLIAALVLVFASIIILSCVPPVSRDALIQHLAIPKLYLKHGGIYEIPSMPFSYFPMNLDLIYMIPLYFGNDIAPKFIHFSFAILTVVIIFSYLRKRIGTAYALLGALLFLSTPIIVKLSITAYVDLGLIFFSTASLLLLIKWCESGFRFKFLSTSAVLCGLAMGTKYNGLISFFLLTLFVPLLYSKYAGERRYLFFKSAGQGIIFFTIAIAVFSPWMARDYLWTGDPLYPLYAQWFIPHQHVSRETIGIFAYRALVYHEKWWQILLLPIRIFFQGQDGNPQFFDGKLNPFLLLLPIMAFVLMKSDSRKIRSEKLIFLAYASLYFVFAFFSAALRIRYISPMVPPLVILAVYGVKTLVDKTGSTCSAEYKWIGALFIGFILFVAISINAVYIFNEFNYVKPFSYLDGSVNRNQYIERYRPEYPAMKYINSKTPSDSKVLFIFLGNRGYYCDRPYTFDMEDNRSRLALLLKESHDPHHVWLTLRKEGITHLLVNLNVFNRWAAESFRPLAMKDLMLFFKTYLKLVFTKNGYGVYELLNPSKIGHEASQS